MNFKEIQELIRLVSKSDLSVFKMKEGDFELTIKTGKEVKTNPSISVPYIPAAPAIPASLPVSKPVLTAEETSASKAASEEESNSNKKLLEIKSPMVGTFYRASGPDKPQFVKVGDPVEVGSTVCIIEAMKLFNEIESEVKGKIVKVLVEDASPVEYDQVLFLVEP
ncbi:MAG: acetyl-CoA carboxylase biotin carboxyl carrier protein [Saprospiraceae bacterium]|nr:acetyl-CoA carboxylase biotin carboxyl carrier protein [Saprospiraceae bacterium]MBK7737631.1 acetyl-CoA carboxylase biotin carboxyl carrier protein [Saprospiraceae bacterium]MBK7913784.1 acetyl-CoA carboxylase biotin carboxyl carrier protein [Saprospiraceae bacterium]